MADFSNTLALSVELDKLFTAIEDDAKAIITDVIPGVQAKRQAVMQKARDKAAGAGAQLDAANKALDRLDAALSNGGPTSGASENSSAAPVDPAKLRLQQRIDQ